MDSQQLVVLSWRCGVQVVREASVRALGLRPFDVQIMGGVVLHEGVISLSAFPTACSVRAVAGSPPGGGAGPAPQHQP